MEDKVLSGEESITYMTPGEIKDYDVYPYQDERKTALKKVRDRIKSLGLWDQGQILGKRYSIGCVALEITQRCNLDCTLCYLSEMSEAVKDVPLQEVFRRIEKIYELYGDNTDVQVTGGDPTLRKKDELLAIIRKIKSTGMRPTLMTNGIKASRQLLTEMREAGLEDVAFHVDLTQERKGFDTEVSLNQIRLDYIQRAKGLGLSVLFNTTVCAENFYEIPEIANFFVKNADVVNFFSFQLQAETGRGVLRERDFIITQDTVTEQVERGIGIKPNFDVVVSGHKKCNRYSSLFVINGNCYDTFFDVDFIQRMIDETSDVVSVRGDQASMATKLVKRVLSNPKNWIPSMVYLARLFWMTKWDLLKAKGKVRKLSFFSHNFMDACQLEKDRIDACSFTVATSEGCISMCLHNAKRDEYILQPVKIDSSETGDTVWNPLIGETNIQETPAEVEIRKGQLKGRLKADRTFQTPVAVKVKGETAAS